MKRGFTLLEMLVASCLLGILVTILTMVFNQSAIAWRTGKGSVADMSTGQMNLAAVGFAGDSVIPGLNQGGDVICTVSPWDDAATEGSVTFAERGVCRLTDLSGRYRRVNASAMAWLAGRPFNVKSVQNWQCTGLGSMNTKGVRNYIVGVKSAGPDRELNTSDDISSWPEIEDMKKQK